MGSKKAPREIAPRIAVDEEVAFGKPVIAGTRIPVEVLVGKVASDMSVEAVAEAYGIDRGDVLAALAFAARALASERYRRVG